MLVLTRKPGEKIVLNGGQIEIVVVDIGNGRCRLGISAPSDVTIDREEVHAKKQNKEKPVESLAKS